MLWINAPSIARAAAPLLPCLVFLITDGKRVFGGNNEDYFGGDTRMWVVPAENGKHGRICFGYADGFVQGGVNDAGLFVDGLALDDQTVSKSDKPDAPGLSSNPCEFTLAECGNVEQVVALFEHHDRGFLASAQLLFGDRSGDAVIVEGNALIRKRGSYLLATNFRQSQTDAPAAECERYQAASRLLGEMKEASVAGCRKVLSATHQEGEVSTLYSNVYDLERGLIHLYHFHDFETDVVINVADELAKGAHTVELASLFPRTFAFSSFLRATEASLEARREKERDKSVDPKTFDGFVGRFRVRKGVAAGLEINVTREQDRLFVAFPGQERTELVPRGGSSFVCISLASRAELKFVPSRGSTFKQLVFKQDDVTARAFKLD